MSKETIQLVISSSSIDELSGIIDNIPLQQIDETLQTIDYELKKRLVSCADDLHASMMAHYASNNISVIAHQLELLEKKLKLMVKDHLPVRHKISMYLKDFFTDGSVEIELEKDIDGIRKICRTISGYNDILIIKSKDFLKYLDIYQNWGLALTKLVSKVSDEYQEEAEVFYRLSKMLSQNSEFLVVQKQLESTIKMQMDNNRLLMTDLLHIIVICDSLAKNTVSIKHFFENEYMGSVKIIKKYKKKR